MSIYLDYFARNLAGPLVSNQLHMHPKRGVEMRPAIHSRTVFIPGLCCRVARARDLANDGWTSTSWSAWLATRTAETGPTAQDGVYNMIDAERTGDAKPNGFPVRCEINYLLS